MAPTPSQPPAGGAQGQDPSMEDILASIRRILNEDEAAAGATDPAATAQPAATQPAAPAAPAGRATDAAEAVPPLELTTAMMIAEMPPLPENEPASLTPAEDPQPGPSAGPVATQARDGLLGSAAAAATAAALGHLARTVAAERNSPVYRGGPSIEDVVREELRPLLRDWLDNNLPPLVERLVRAEIERVVGRALS